MKEIAHHQITLNGEWLFKGTQHSLFFIYHNITGQNPMSDADYDYYIGLLERMEGVKISGDVSLISPAGRTIRQATLLPRTEG